jgi:hypothetical protein
VPLWVRLAVFAFAAAVTSVFFIDFCALVFQCGCRSLWAGAAEHCNIHTPNVRHCPFCVIGGRAIWAIIVAAQAGVAFGLRRVGSATLAIAALLAFPAVGGIAALIAGLSTGYWAGTSP